MVPSSGRRHALDRGWKTRPARSTFAAGTGYVTAGDADEVDNLSAITVTMWVKLTGTPVAGDRLIGNWPATFPAPSSGTRGWYLNIDDSYFGWDFDGERVRRVGLACQLERHVFGCDRYHLAGGLQRR